MNSNHLNNFTVKNEITSSLGCASRAPGGMSGWQYQTPCSQLWAAGGRVAQLCRSGVSAVVSDQGDGLLYAWCRIQPPRVGLVQKWHGARGHWNCEFWQVISGKSERRRYLYIHSNDSLLSFQGDSHGFVRRLRSAQHICWGSAGTPVRNNRFTVFPKAFRLTRCYRSREVGKDDGRGLLWLLKQHDDNIFLLFF